MKITILSLFFSILVHQSFTQEVSLASLLPDPAIMDGWQYSREPECFAGDKLFDLIDGAADLYFEYGFVKAVNVHYAESSGSKIQLEIYQMDSDSSAYGIFSSIFNSSDVEREIGLYSVTQDQYVAFVKDRYYVNIAWVLRKDARQESLQTLAREVEKNIPLIGGLPTSVRKVESIDHTGIPIYFKGNIALSNIYYFDFKDPFKVKQGVALQGNNVIKLILFYKDKESSMNIFTGAHDFIKSSKRFGDLGMIYQGFTCSDNKGNRLAFRLGQGYILTVVALNQEINLLTELEDFSFSVEKSITN